MEIQAYRAVGVCAEDFEHLHAPRLARATVLTGDNRAPVARSTPGDSPAATALDPDCLKAVGHRFDTYRAHVSTRVFVLGPARAVRT